MARLMRMSSMVHGMPCVVIVNDEVKHYTVHENTSKNTLYVQYQGKRFYEDDLPMGEEITV